MSYVFHLKIFAKNIFYPLFCFSSLNDRIMIVQSHMLTNFSFWIHILFIIVAVVI